jgi:hypothetical protein
MENRLLKDEIKKLKQEVHQLDTRLSVHKSIQNQSDTILQAPPKETLATLYEELVNLGLTESKTQLRKKSIDFILVFLGSKAPYLS